MFIYLNTIESAEDRNKFEQLYLTYRQTMFYAANRIIKDEHLAEDIVHQAFLRIMDNLDKIDDNNCHKTKGFIVVIVENIAIDFYRKRKSGKHLSFDEMEVYIKDIKNESDFILNEVEESILKLPINYSTVLKLKYSQGYNNKEISEILKITEENVHQRISRGKNKLTKILDKERNVSYE